MGFSLGSITKPLAAVVKPFISNPIQAAIAPAVAITQGAIGGVQSALGQDAEKKKQEQEAALAAQRAEIDRSFQLTPEESAVGTTPFEKVALTRLGTQEELAQRQKIARDLAVQQQAAQRQLASQQARMGMRGGAAAAQQAQLARQVAKQRAAQEEEAQLGRTMFNLTQEQKERFANLAAELARQQMLAAKAGQKMQSRAAALGGVQQVQAAQTAAQPQGLFGQLFGGLFS